MQELIICQVFGICATDKCVPFDKDSFTVRIPKQNDNYYREASLLELIIATFCYFQKLSNLFFLSFYRNKVIFQIR